MIEKNLKVNTRNAHVLGIAQNPVATNINVPVPALEPSAGATHEVCLGNAVVTNRSPRSGHCRNPAAGGTGHDQNLALKVVLNTERVKNRPKGPVLQAVGRVLLK